MSTTGCNEFVSQLEGWMEGERSSGAQAHWRECANCRALAGDLEAVREAAQASAALEVEPPARIWVSLRAQLEHEGVIRSGRTGWLEKLKAYFDGTFAILPRPALAGAYLAAVIAVAAALVAPGVRQPDESRWIAGNQRATEPLSAQLASAEQDTMSTWADSNPAVTASLHQNLAIVDNYIVLCEKSVREEPENEFARDYLYDAYQQKAALLAQMTERGE
ncbi:MAG: hypothetical protein LAN59_15080 [Acidobacteriia bacterium]|nr:hypothetical protein [Terriglobia bacterium]